MYKNRSKHKMYRDIQFEKIAKEHRLFYSYKDEFGLIKLLRDFQLFRNFSSNKITNILGEKTKFRESNFNVFDFEYRIFNGEQEEMSTQTVFFAQSKQLALPQFYMEPGHFFKQVGKHVGTIEVDFEVFPQFTKQYWLKGAQEQPQKTLPDNLRHYFTMEEDWCFEGLNYFLILYRKDKLIPTTDLIDFFQKGKEIVENFSK